MHCTYSQFFSSQALFKLVLEEHSTEYSARYIEKLHSSHGVFIFKISHRISFEKRDIWERQLAIFLLIFKDLYILAEIVVRI